MYSSEGGEQGVGTAAGGGTFECAQCIDCNGRAEAVDSDVAAVDTEAGGEGRWNGLKRRCA